MGVFKPRLSEILLLLIFRCKRIELEARLMRARDSCRVTPFGLANGLAYGLAVAWDPLRISIWLRLLANASVRLPWIPVRFIAELGIRNVPRLAPASPKES